nr:retrovirus-related Pol polyprotein from transposon TNT 1-94 [Tanacetum cinerariifolium]
MHRNITQMQNQTTLDAEPGRTQALEQETRDLDMEIKQMKVLKAGYYVTTMQELRHSGLNVPVFKPGDDPIDAINHMMPFLLALVTSRFPTTNNQLRNSSNPKKQATINDRRVTVQPVQGRNISFAMGEGHMSKQCTKPKRKQDDSWFKDKVLRVQAQANGQILREEKLAFLAHLGILKVALMANLAHYGSDALDKVHNHDNVVNSMINQGVQSSKTSAQQHALILSVIKQLKTQVINYTKINLDNKTVNDTLTVELEGYKEQVKALKEGQNVKDKVKKDIEDIETINIELDHRVSKLIVENEHLKQTYKQLYDSILSKRVRSKEQCDALINQVNLKSVEISDLNANLQKQGLIIAALRDELRKLKGKVIVDTTVTTHTIDPEMLKVDVEPIAPRLLNNRTVYSDYLRLTQEQAAIFKEVVVQIVLWYLDSSCSKHMTRDRSQLTNFVKQFLGTVKFGNDHVASKTKSWLWHRRPSHLNFGTINHLARHSLVRGLFKLKFEKDHLGSACVMGKSKKKPHKPKSEDTNQEKLYILHVDLCGPMCVASGKKYILFIVDDYSRFTRVKCLRSKDEAPDFIIKFLKMIQVRLKTHVWQIRTDNGTEFVNQTLRKYYENVGISHETSISCSSQQNDGIKRQNCTLIKAAHTMLIYVKASLFLWAEAVATACYTQNRSIIRLHHGKTPYEILHDKLPDLSFFH